METLAVRLRAPAPSFWRGKRVLLTGHTGFKGGWAALWLKELGAEVTGFSRAPDQTPALFDLARVPKATARSVIADLTEVLPLRQAMVAAKPDIVLHMAAQSLVRRSVRDPVDTFRSNVIGTVELLEAARCLASVRTILVVTSDKIYTNSENGVAFCEEDRLGGKDPYSASKAATELAVRAWRETYFARSGARLASVRGGNVIGGGDFSEDRLVPDAVRAAVSSKPLVLRHPEATRPWQHVLDCLAGYFAYIEALHEGADIPLALNIGPKHGLEMAVGSLASRILEALGVLDGWRHKADPGSIEMKALAIDSRLAAEALGWHGALSMEEAADWTASWYRAWRDGADMRAVTLSQIGCYMGLNGRCLQ